MPPAPRRRRLRTTALLAALMLATACTAEPEPPAGPAPEVLAWAGAVCTGLDPWREEIGDLTASAQEHLTPGTSPADARDALVGLLDGAADASERARAAVEAAGVPAVADGEAVWTAIVDRLAAARDAYAAAAETMRGLDPRAEDFYDGVAAAMDDLNSAYGDGATIAALDSPELKAAFDTAPECA